MKKIAWLLPLLFAAPLFAQTDAIQGYCDRGGTHSLVSGLPATNWQLGNIPACTVTVYFTGTTTKVPVLYADSLGTPLGNPFTATTSTSPNPGYWIFWAPVGVGYDVTMSGGGGVPTCTTQPNCYAIPITKTDLKVGGGGGGSGVTNFSAGNLPPLFTTTVTNSGTTPNLGFNLSNAPGNSIFGNFNGTSGPPFYAIFTCTGLLTCVYNSGTNTWNVNIPSTSALSVTTVDPIKVNGGNGPVASGTASISCPDCGTGGLQMVPNNLPAGNYVILKPNAHAITANSGACVTPVADNTSATLALNIQGGGFPPSTCTVQWTFNGAWAAQYPSIPTGNITGVTAFVISSWNKAVGSASITSNAANMTPSGLSGFGWPLQSTYAVASWTGATIDTAHVDASLSRSGTTSGLLSTLTVDNIGLAVYINVAAPAASTAFNVLPPLSLDTRNMTLGLDPAFPAWLIPQPISQLPAPAANFNQIQAVNNGISATDCAAGGGSFTVLCQTYSGNAWTAISGTGTSTTYFTEVVTCTTTCTLAHTPVTFDNFSVNGLVMVNGADFTRSGVTVTLTTPASGGDVYYAQYHY